MNNILKSIGALLLGLFSNVVLSTAMDFLFKSNGLLPYDHLFVDTWIVMLVFGYRVVFSLFGCYLAARLSPNSPMKHSLILSGIGFVLSTVGAVIMGHLGPLWYSWGLVAVCFPVGWLGGKLVQIQLKQ
jgi:hypothetical protein